MKRYRVRWSETFERIVDVPDGLDPEAYALEDCDYSADYVSGSTELLSVQEVTA